MLLLHDTGWRIHVKSIIERAPPDPHTAHLFGNGSSLEVRVGAIADGRRPVTIIWHREDGSAGRDELLASPGNFWRGPERLGAHVALDVTARRWERVSGADSGHQSLPHSTLELEEWLAASPRVQMKAVSRAKTLYWQLGEALYHAPRLGGRTWGEDVFAALRALRGNSGELRQLPRVEDLRVHLSTTVVDATLLSGRHSLQRLGQRLLESRI